MYDQVFFAVCLGVTEIGNPGLFGSVTYREEIAPFYDFGRNGHVAGNGKRKAITIDLESYRLYILVMGILPETDIPANLCRGVTPLFVGLENGFPGFGYGKGINSRKTD
jgi:hypothetical protein